MKRVLIVFGTRPEAIKMAPVVRAFAAAGRNGRRRSASRAQHRAMLDQVLSLFGIEPDFDLDLMSASQTLEGLSARILEAMSGVLHAWRPDLVAGARRHHHDLHGHPGLFLQPGASRPCGGRLAHRQPGVALAGGIEPAHRRPGGAGCTSRPRRLARNNLLAENVPPATIEVTGNTVIDALAQTAGRLRHEPALSLPLRERFAFLREDRKLLPRHRPPPRELRRGPARDLRCAAAPVAPRGPCRSSTPSTSIPNVKGPVEAALAGVPELHLLPPQDYLAFVYLMMNVPHHPRPTAAASRKRRRRWASPCW
jgi:UDP-N-acetylglucosamine 2-epimerase